LNRAPLHWGKSPEENQKMDKYKMDLALKQEYSLIRIYQPDVLKDRHNWKEKLKAAIKKYDKPTIVLIGDIYKDHPTFWPDGNTNTDEFIK
jgi:hypothetical protein